MIFTLCGFFGIYIFYMRWKKSSTSCRVLGKFQLSLLVLVCFTSVAIFIANICGSAKSSSNNLVDSQLWSELVRSHPEYTCSIERRLKCAGFQPGHCKFSRNKRSNSNCAGHFCIDFCHISTRRVNMDTMCKACRRNPYKSIALFGTCKRIERKESDGDGCKGKIESDLRKSYKKLLTSSIIRCLCILLTLSVTLLPHCC